jgi:prepilin-type processing-associated H-X9-DG protein
MSDWIYGIIGFLSHSGGDGLVLIPLFVVFGVLMRRADVANRRAYAEQNVRSVRLATLARLGAGALMVLNALTFLAAFAHLACAREMSRQAACQSNMKQLGLGLLMYAYDNDARLPPAAVWDWRIEPYVKSPSLFRCPDVTPPATYGANAAAGGVNIERVAEASQTVLLFEADTVVRSFYGGKVDVARERHSGGSHFAFVDGHAKRVSAAGVDALTWEPTTPAKAKPKGAIR